MLSTMTWVGLDVHAAACTPRRSTPRPGELRRARLGGEHATRWCASWARCGARCGRSTRPARRASGWRAPARRGGDRDGGGGAGQDAARCGGSGQDRSARRRAAGAAADGRARCGRSRPGEEQEAARDLVRAREALRQDLMRCPPPRVEAAAAPRPGLRRPRRTWTVGAIATGWPRQRFASRRSQLAYIDALAAVDGLARAPRRCSSSTSHRSPPATSCWPTVARLRAFRGVDTLTALGPATELGDFEPLRRGRASCAAGWDWRRASRQSGQSTQPRGDHQDRLHARAPAAGRSGLALHPPAAGRPDAAQPPGRPAGRDPADRLARPAPPYQHPHPAARARQARQRRHRRRRPRARPASSGPPPPRSDAGSDLCARSPGRPRSPARAITSMGSPHRGDARS